MGRFLGLMLFLAFIFLGCQRPASSDFTKVTITTPAARHPASKTGGVGALSAMPTDRKACYGVNVLGEKIQSRASSCGPTVGVIGGFVEPGQDIEIELLKGSGRTVELYAYLLPAGNTGPCPGFVGNLPVAQITHTYLLNSVANVDMNQDTTRVDIKAEFPGVANNIATQLSLPAVCVNVPPTRPADFSSGRGIASGGGMKLLGVSGKAAGVQQATGGGMRLITQ